jgi:hypothetical protein
MSSRTLPRHPFSSVPEYWDWVPNASGLSKEPLGIPTMVLFVSLHAKHIKQTPCVVGQLSKTGQLIGTGGQERRLRASCSAPSRTPAVPRRPSFRGRTSTPGGEPFSPEKSFHRRSMHACTAGRLIDGSPLGENERGPEGFEDHSQHEDVTQVSARSSCEVHLSDAVPV